MIPKPYTWIRNNLRANTLPGHEPERLTPGEIVIIQYIEEIMLPIMERHTSQFHRVLPLAREHRLISHDAAVFEEKLRSE